MGENEIVDKKVVKVLVTLNNDIEFFARIFLGRNQRLQDAMNDERKYLPVERHMQTRGRYSEDTWAMCVIHKDQIRSVEER